MSNCKTIYTFKEAIDLKSLVPFSPWGIGSPFKAVFYSSCVNAPIWVNSGGDYIPKPYIEDLYALLKARFYDWYAVEINSEDEPLTASSPELSAFITRFINIIVNTYDKYAAILAAFNTAKSKLMGQVEATTETGYNDTPQSEGDYTDDTHRSSYTKVTSKVDGATPIERLDEIQKKIRNIMLEWSNEFKPLFWTD